MVLVIVQQKAVNKKTIQIKREKHIIKGKSGKSWKGRKGGKREKEEKVLI